MTEKKIKDMTTEELTEALYKESQVLAIKELKTLEYKMTSIARDATLENGSEVVVLAVNLEDIESYVKSRIQILKKGKR